MEVAFTLSPEDAGALQRLVGPHQETLKWLEDIWLVKIRQRSFAFECEGEPEAIEAVKELVENLYVKALAGELNREWVLQKIQTLHYAENESGMMKLSGESHTIHTPRKEIDLKTQSQRQYIDKIRSHDITFSDGPAGTGKTYLAVACAVAAWDAGEIERIILTRPTVEAGEKLGFLPGDLAQKVDPFLTPLYDALEEMIGSQKFQWCLDKKIIQMAPLAYMRGRTLKHSFVILDEAQNTSSLQMKMFLTRIGLDTKMVITGDLGQIDLPKSQQSGLMEAVNKLENIPGIACHRFVESDIVRHPLVGRILKAYAQ